MLKLRKSWWTTLLSICCSWTIGNCVAQEVKQPSISILPVVITPDPVSDDFSRRIAMALGTMLESSELTDIQVLEKGVPGPLPEEAQELGKTVGKFVAAMAQEGKQLEGRQFVFAEFVGTPKTGVRAIHTMVFDDKGKVLFLDTANEEKLKKGPTRPADPMTCCEFAASRLREHWKLSDTPTKAGKKFSEFWRKDAGVPTEQELVKISERRKQMNRDKSNSTLQVYPVQVNGKLDTAITNDLMDRLKSSGFANVVSIDSHEVITVQPHTNEQKILWDTARNYQNVVRKNDAASKNTNNGRYSLFVDIGLNQDVPGYVHFFVCDSKGEWVVVDFQNSHHADFSKLAPKSPIDCNQLVVKRLKE